MSGRQKRGGSKVKDLLTKAGKSRSGHSKVLEELSRMYSGEPEDFSADLWRHLQYVLCASCGRGAGQDTTSSRTTSASVSRILELITRLCVAVPTLTNSLLPPLCEAATSPDRVVRSRATNLVSSVLCTLPDTFSPPAELLEQAEVCLLERARDKAATVRQEACAGLGRLIVSEGTEDKCGDELRRLAREDSSSGVRAAALRCLGLMRFEDVDEIVGRSRDVAEEVRVACFQVAEAGVALGSLRRWQRARMAGDGLADRSEKVRSACEGMVMRRWLAQDCGGEPTKLLRELLPEKFEKESEMVARCLTKARVPCEPESEKEELLDIAVVLLRRAFGVEVTWADAADIVDRASKEQAPKWALVKQVLLWAKECGKDNSSGDGARELSSAAKRVVLVGDDDASAVALDVFCSRDPQWEDALSDVVRESFAKGKEARSCQVAATLLCNATEGCDVSWVRDLLRPCLTNKDPEVRDWAVKVCSVSLCRNPAPPGRAPEAPSGEVSGLLQIFLHMVGNDTEKVGATALQAVMDLIVARVVEPTCALLDSSLLCLITPGDCAEQSSVTPEIMATAVEGFCKLLWNQRLCKGAASDVLARLEVLSHHPSSVQPARLRQCLCVFFPSFCGVKANASLLQEAVVKCVDVAVGLCNCKLDLAVQCGCFALGMLRTCASSPSVMTSVGVSLCKKAMDSQEPAVVKVCGRIMGSALEVKEAHQGLRGHVEQMLDREELDSITRRALSKVAKALDVLGKWSKQDVAAFKSAIVDSQSEARSSRDPAPSENEGEESRREAGGREDSTQVVAEEAVEERDQRPEDNAVAEETHDSRVAAEAEDAPAHEEEEGEEQEGEEDVEEQEEKEEEKGEVHEEEKNEEREGEQGVKGEEQEVKEDEEEHEDVEADEDKENDPEGEQNAKVEAEPAQVQEGTPKVVPLPNRHRLRKRV